jgi:hypothetical protein
MMRQALLRQTATAMALQARQQESQALRRAKKKRESQR